MATDFRFDPGSRLVVTCYWDSVRVADVAAVRRARERDPRLAAATAHLVDATGISHLELSAPETREVAAYVTSGKDETSRLPTAVIASSDVVFGMCRMFGLRVEVLRDSEQVRVFRTWEDAAGWLRLDLERARSLADEMRTGPGLGVDDLGGTRDLA